MKIRSLPALLVAGLLLATATLSLMGCANIIYREPASNYAGRPIPPSGLLQRVMASYTINGSQGGLEILDGLRDIRSNVQNTIPSFSIKGFSSAQPIQILNFPEQTTGYVLSYTDGSLVAVNYSTESSSGSVASIGPTPPSAAVSPNGPVFAGAAEQSGAISLNVGGVSVGLNLPNVDKVVVNQGGSVILAMVRNSNSLYRVVKLPATNNPVLPPGYVDCEPLLLPSFCIVPVAGTYDHPTNAVFSLDGNTVYVLNCGPECGGTTSGVTLLQEGALITTSVPTVNPLTQPPPYATLPTGVSNPIPVPGGVTAGLSDSTNLYLAGQSLQSGVFGGNLSLLNLTSYTVTNSYPIADGTHSKLLFADDNTLWVTSTQCANGVRAAAAAAGNQTQAANYSCLTRFVPNAPIGNTTAPILPTWVANVAYIPGEQLCDGAPMPAPYGSTASAGCSSGNVEVVQTGGTSGASAPKWSTTLDGATTDGSVTWVNIGPVSPVQIIPVITPNNTTATNITNLYPNTNLNATYYGNLTGLCWVQNYHKVFTAYGGQIHAFNTQDGSEINNFYITIQGTVFDVAYLDAETNSAD